MTPSPDDDALMDTVPGSGEHRSIPSLPPEWQGKPDPFLGTTLANQYKILEVIGEGGMGVVYRAHQINVERDVAVKILRPDFCNDPSLVRRFVNEARIISRLRHPNTLRLYDYQVTAEGDLFIVTELLAGFPLAKVLAGGALPFDRAIDVADQVAASLSEAHAAGIIHRDIKPENVFLDRVGNEDVVKVLDFGIAKLVQQDAAMLTGTGKLVGTPLYMSPEQAKGESVDHRSDLYSLGVLLFHMLAGEPPFNGATPVVVAVKHIQDEPPRVRDRAPKAVLPIELEDLVLRMLQKSPGARLPSIDAVREALADIAHAEGVPRVGSSPKYKPDFTPFVPDASNEGVAPANPVPPGATPASLAESLAQAKTHEISIPADKVVEPVKPPKARWPVAAAALAAAAIVGVAASRLLPAPEAPAPIAAPSPPAAPSGGLPDNLEVPGPGPRAVRLMSEPDGADVFDPEGRHLGVTALEFDLQIAGTYRVVARDGLEETVDLDPREDGGTKVLLKLKQPPPPPPEPSAKRPASAGKKPPKTKRPGPLKVEWE